jgi:hypothetical protein
LTARAHPGYCFSEIPYKQGSRSPGESNGRASAGKRKKEESKRLNDSEMAPQAVEIVQNGLGNGADEVRGRGQRPTMSNG